MQNIIYKQTPPGNHTHLRCDVGDRYVVYLSIDII